MKPIVVHPAAELELDKAVAYLDGQRPGIGREFQDEIQRLLGELQKNPALGGYYGRSGYRHFPVERFRYVIYYTERPEAIRVAAIAHGSRRPGYWRNRRFD